MQQFSGLERLPPHSIEAEQALLGAILLHNLVLGEVIGIVQPNHFFEPLHGRIFEAIQNLIQESKPADPITLAPFFENEAPINDFTVKQYLGRLVAGATTIINARAYAEAIREGAMRREMIVVAEDLLESSYDQSKPVLNTAGLAAEGLTGIIVSPGDGRKSSELMGKTAKRVLARLRSKEKLDNVVATGLIDLDRALGGGFYDGDLIFIAGRPSMGKTALGQQIAMNVARAQPENGVLFFSLEMIKDTLTARGLSSLVYTRDNPIVYQDIIARKVPEGQIYRLEEAAARFESAPLLIDDKSGLTVPQISARARVVAARWQRQGVRLRLLLVDHMLLVEPDDRYRGQKVNEVAKISAGFKMLAKELGIPVAVLHQLSRKTEERENRRPEMSDLRESGATEQDADVILFPYRPAYYLERMKFDDEEKEKKRTDKLSEKHNLLEVIIGKQRNGPCITVELFADIASNVIRNKAA